jgi:hypothetical protein
MPTLIATSVKRVAIAGACLGALGAAFVFGFYLGEARGFNVGISQRIPPGKQHIPLPALTLPVNYP